MYVYGGYNFSFEFLRIKIRLVIKKKYFFFNLISKPTLVSPVKISFYKTNIKRLKKKRDPRLNFKKMHKGRIQMFEFSKKRLCLQFGTVGIRAKNSGRIRAYHLENIRRLLFRHAGRRLRFWNRSFLKYFLTTKAISIRMGRGKGTLSASVARISGGSVILEFTGVSMETLQEIKKPILNKMKVPCEFILRNAYI